MANQLLINNIVFSSLLFLVLTITIASASRMLDETDPSLVDAAPAAASTTPISGVSPVVTTTSPVSSAASNPSSVVGGATAANTNSNTVGSGGGAGTGDNHDMIFFMHDILGGSNPTARAMTGIVTNPAVNGQVPFAKPNGAVLPINNGLPVNNANSAIINNNNLPFLTGLGGTIQNVGQNQNTNGNNIIGGVSGFPVLNSAQLPSGSTFQKLMFGTITAFDDELTEGHQLGSGLVGKAQGFYVASSEDGNSQTLAFTATFKNGGYEDSISFFGIHRIAVSESHLAIMGGTGKYVNVKGFAVVKTLPPGTNQQETDGMETVLEISVYLSY
ncbi:dirigent protein 25-like [Impatiens glandulifera]|uniref:dirigent protein 25-like n=1 Tax=Impatiens glandulifera TaxID=253017 RepID=UPI001FB0A236|nr:dirigent protein 25-like [Impatiens glandulifera]